MNPELCKQVIQGLGGAYKGLRLYPVQHPAIERQLQHLLKALMALLPGKKQVNLGLLEGTLFLDEHLFPDDDPAAQVLAKLLQTLELEGFEFHPGLTAEELRSFLQMLGQGQIKGEAFDDLLPEHGVHNIRQAKIKTTEEEEQEKPQKVYGRALKVVDQIFHDVRLGRIPSSEEARQVVTNMVKLTISDPHALFALSMLKDYDNYTFTHSVNVSVISLAVGRSCGLSEERLRVLGLGGLLHDMGKLIIDRNIITKPGRLTEEEFEEIKKHPANGIIIARQMDGINQDVLDIILGHHLRYDRQGYPANARGHDISNLADMTAIADTYDAMTTLRSYQRPMTPRRAVERLGELAGTVLHPEYLQGFVAALGNYPVGSLVRLANNEIGLVIRVGAEDPDEVQLKIIFNAEGQKLAQPLPRKLSGAQGGRRP